VGQFDVVRRCQDSNQRRVLGAFAFRWRQDSTRRGKFRSRLEGPAGPGAWFWTNHGVIRIPCECRRVQRPGIPLSRGTAVWRTPRSCGPRWECTRAGFAWQSPCRRSGGAEHELRYAAGDHARGCLVYKSPGFILQVDDSPEVLQLAGGPLNQRVGNRVEVTGTPSPTAATIVPATILLNVSNLTIRATGGCLTTAAALNAQTSVPAGTTPASPTVGANPTPAGAKAPVVVKTGMSTAAKVGIIGAVAGGGAGAAIALGGKKSSTSP
jgi:hypothetical protein